MPEGKQFEIQKHDHSDKRFEITGPSSYEGGLLLFVDYDDVDHDRVDVESVEAVRALNSHELLVKALEARVAYQKFADNPKGPTNNPFGHDCQWCSDCYWKMVKMAENALAAAGKGD